MAAHGLHHLLPGSPQQIPHRLVGDDRVAEQIGEEQGAGQAGPAAVRPSAVDAGGDGVLLAAEYADAVVEGGEEEHILGHAVVTAEGLHLVQIQAGEAIPQGSVLPVIKVAEIPAV